MPSMPSLTSYALSGLSIAQTALGLQNAVSRMPRALLAASETCNNPQLSCHNTTAVQNLCCFNAPGGSLLQTQFWDTNPASGPADSWTIHGLWPDNCDGTYDSYCDDSRAYTNITAILRASGHTTLLNWMQTYWTSNQGTAESFWEHEWGKHGTCISTLDPNCYTNYEPTEEVPDFFERVVSLFKSLPSYDWLKAAGITPSTTKTYTRAEIQTALSQHHDGMKVYLGCSSGELDEIWYYFNVRGSLQTGTFVPSKDIGGASSCPDTGIKYLPKSSSGGSPTTTAQSTGTTTSASTSTAAPFEGKGYLNVIQSDGTQNGCLISHGTWYTTGTCATYTATSEPGNKFTLTSSKGLCEVQADGEFYCGADVTKATNFRAQGAELVVHGKTAFYADKVSTGQDQEVVYAKAQGHGVEITVEWEAR